MYEFVVFNISRHEHARIFPKTIKEYSLKVRLQTSWTSVARLFSKPLGNEHEEVTLNQLTSSKKGFSMFG